MSDSQLVDVRVSHYDRRGRGGPYALYGSFPFDEAAALVRELRQLEDVHWAYCTEPDTQDTAIAVATEKDT